MVRFGRYFIVCVFLAILSLCYNLDYLHSETSSPSLTQPITLTNERSSKALKAITQSNILPDLKYLLIWFNQTEPIRSNFREGKKMFKNKNCPFTECYATENRKLLKDVSDFDVILFHGRELTDNASLLPQSRSPHQKYIYANMESSVNFPVCNPMYNSFFNWTWTYKLDSDEYYGYFSIRDKKGNDIGPKKEMHWMKLEDMMPINDTLKAKLSTKKIAVAWFVSHCGASSGRDFVARKLQAELAKYKMQVDVFGKCGTKKCPRGMMKECLQRVESDYYFYLSFENTFAEDYVTEKLLIALNHYAVPVVYGGANYTRFMPDGIYLTAQKSGIKKLARQIVNIIKNKQKYYDFFRWHNHYSYHNVREPPNKDPYCKLCALLHNKDKYLRTSVYKDFSQWWNPPEKCQ